MSERKPCRASEMKWKSLRRRLWIISNWNPFNTIADGMSNIFADAWRVWIAYRKCMKTTWKYLKVSWGASPYYEYHRSFNDTSKLCTGRTIVFAQTSGISLEGHVMLFTGDVQHNWLDVWLCWNQILVLCNILWVFQFIRNMSKQDAYLKRIPLYEQALSQVMRNIRVARRKFMPKAQVVHYAAHLCNVTTSMLDFLTLHSKYPKSWPETMENFEIVIES